ncbi:MAG TPA: ChbG/HpnK family deacetylase, partial [Rhabdaerophilum sp.]|nr:ChbG/HpnK family deacetylase [Rhabdaerophilum sp.]
MPAPRPFVLCADDYGMTPAVSRGILRLIEAGRISATGAMT